MKFSVDGDQICVTKDDFVNLQESPAVFYPLEGDIAKILLKDGILGLPIGMLCKVTRDLKIADCGYNCIYQEPYGFVPEAGCPIHDTDKSGLTKRARDR